MATRPDNYLIEQIEAMEHGVIRVFRDSAKDIGFREAVLFLDGKEMGNVEFKRSVELEVKPGPHRIKAFNRVFWSQEIELDVRPGERISLQVANVGGWLFAIFMLLQMGIPRITLERETLGRDPLLSPEFDSSRSA